jgi:hypothetical protein
MLPHDGDVGNSRRIYTRRDSPAQNNNHMVSLFFMEVRMKKIIGLFILATLLLSCGQKADKPETPQEDGIEVVVNRSEPYRIKGEESNIRLEEEFVIDLEEPSVSNLGLFELESFAVSSAGEIFLLQERTESDYIYKFSRDGCFLLSFARNGRGPGELSQPIYITSTPDGQIQVTDYINVKLAVYNSDGSLAREAGEYMIDVFNPDGVFTGRLSADISLSALTPLIALVRSGRLHYIREKADGYKQLVVERMLQE